MLIRDVSTRAMAWFDINFSAGTTEIALHLGDTKALVIQVHHKRCMISESVWFVADSTGLDSVYNHGNLLSRCSTNLYIRL